MARGEEGPDRPNVVGSAGSQPPRTGEAPATSSEDVASHSALWRISNWRLRTKLLVVLLIPSIAAAVLGVMRVSVDYNEYVALESNTEQVRLNGFAADTVHELQRERDLTSLYLASTVGGGQPGNRSEMDKQRTRVDEAIKSFRGEIENVENGSHPEVVGKYRTVADQLSRLQALRTVADGNTYPPDAAYRAYTDSVKSLLGLSEGGIGEINNEEVVRISQAVSSMSRVKENESTKRALLGEAVVRGNLDTNDQRAFLAADAELDNALADFERVTYPHEEQRYDDTVAGQKVDRARTIEATALVRGENNEPLGEDPAEWFAVSSEVVNLTSQVSDELRNDLRTHLRAAADEARTEMYVYGGLVLAALALAFAIALLVARSLLAPLRTLRRSALEMADKRLPEAVESILHDPNPNIAATSKLEPIPVHTREEIGRVARSFDQVHTQALRLASEQALLRNNVNDLFVNLARRSQTLVQRQLSLIDRLEQDEQDPDQLSSLFELDHLATRMRRNNENLLILGGTDLTRRMMRPVALSEVVGAAVSEVEQYARVMVTDAPDLAIQGRVVNDFVHLVAELLENATVFSNPDTEVSVRTAYRRQELVLEIRDRGVGIDASEIDDINDRLTRPPEIDVSVSRRMGLYVVSQLARRHGIRVSLQNNGDLEGGVTATVRLSGEYVSQMTPDGPMPMPDMQRAQNEQQRDALSETGAHAGLAAAFGLPGGEVPPAEQPYEPPAALPQRTPGESPSGQVSPPKSTTDSDPGYSVQVSTGSTFGASEIPQWEDSAQRNESVEQWPSEEAAADGGAFTRGDSSDLFDGQCGAPPEMEGTADLFRSPFEAEKSAGFVEPDNEWPLDDPVVEQAEGPAPSSAPTGLGSGPTNQADVDDAPTERLPIYEAVLSQWFRESGDVTESAADTARADSARNGTAESTSNASSVSPNGTAEAGPGGDRTGARPDGSLSAQGGDSNGSTLGEQQPLAAPQAPDPGWGSADVGWEAAEALVEQSKQEQETTSAGLPKRVPKSNLVPGSAASKPQSSTPSKRAAPRSAEAVRGRMSNFQKGIHRGRHAKAESVSPDQSNSMPSRHEEQE